MAKYSITEPHRNLLVLDRNVLGNEYSYVKSYNSSHIYHIQSSAE